MKDLIRKQYLEKRNSLTDEEIKEKSRKITANLKNLPEFRNAETIMLYLSFQSEVNTHELADEFNGLKKIAVPVTKNKEIIPAVFSSEIKENIYGIEEPVDADEINKKEIDIVLVPGICFDKKGNRIGRGEGYYDRFLKDIKAKKIALAYELQIAENVPADEHDIPVDIIVTEERVINIKYK